MVVEEAPAADGPFVTARRVVERSAALRFVPSDARCRWDAPRGLFLVDGSEAVLGAAGLVDVLGFAGLGGVVGLVGVVPVVVGRFGALVGVVEFDDRGRCVAP